MVKRLNNCSYKANRYKPQHPMGRRHFQRAVAFVTLAGEVDLLVVVSRRHDAFVLLRVVSRATADDAERVQHSLREFPAVRELDGFVPRIADVVLGRELVAVDEKSLRSRHREVERVCTSFIVGGIAKIAVDGQGRFEGKTEENNGLSNHGDNERRYLLTVR